jgi:pimeloyl-ACP methyl ester carboxylesterase
LAPTAANQQPAPRPVLIPVPGGLELKGTLYGDGQTGLVLAHMSDSHQDTWAGFAQDAAEAGYLALTFDFRFWNNGRIDDRLRDKAAEDVLAASDFLRAQGAGQVALVGASLGGMASARAALQSDPEAVIILAAPLDWPDWPSIRVSKADIAAIDAPVLFVNSERDDFVEDTRCMVEAAGEPKELEIYPGGAHGTDLFHTAHAPDLTARLLAFLQTHAPATQP